MKTNIFGFRQGRTQNGLYSHRWLEVKTKALISFAVTAELICAFDFASVDCRFSHAAAHISVFELHLKFKNALLIIEGKHHTQ